MVTKKDFVGNNFITFEIIRYILHIFQLDRSDFFQVDSGVVRPPNGLVWNYWEDLYICQIARNQSNANKLVGI